ncbi:MAG: hypothetical protein RMI34_05340 [Chloroherpetonaceae bacterium]|nr:hypothetical protein [Chloroherpetonaceae bacterium]MDW8019483.1 hypothetical protein [Chloroherpetonaceae bacterium]MDW8465885.1 hypothetical protein [Chloroherpetonaceae bacterium]
MDNTLKQVKADTEQARLNAEQQPVEKPSQPEKEKGLLSGLFQRSFELEMLVSGVAILTLLRAPELLETLFEWAALNTKEGVDFFGIIAFVARAAKAITYLVAFNFILHLFLRCFWVGLVGLRSVFQSEADLEAIVKHSPPLYRRFYEERGYSLESLAERVDRLCRMLFAFTFVVVATVLYVVIGFLFGALIAREKWLLVVAGTFFIALLLLSALDYAAKRLRPFSRWANVPWLVRFAKGIYGIGDWIILGVIYRPLSIAFKANKSSAMLYGGVFVYVIAFIVIALIALGIKVDNFDFFPDRWRGAYMIRGSYYENLRSEGKLSLAPYIQSDIVREPFVRLVIPYYVNLNDSVLARAPALAEMNRYEPTAEQVKLAIETMRSFYRITLNDSTLSELEFAFYKNPKNEQPSMVAYIPAEHLPKGKNTLVIKASKDEWVIPFYR